MSQDLKTITILFRTKNALEEVMLQDVRRQGLNLTEFGAMEVLYHKGTLPVQTITEKVLVANSSMTYVLDKLITKGYVEKEQSSLDKRSFLVSLTPEGKTLLDRIYPRHVQKMRRVLDLLTAEEERTLQSLLKKIGKQA